MSWGEAVSVGMMVATQVAISLGLCSKEVERRLVSLLRRFCLDQN